MATQAAPRFPALYNPAFERNTAFLDTHHVALSAPDDVYRFTLYWAFTLFGPLFLVPGLWALAMIALALSRRAADGDRPASAVKRGFTARRSDPGQQAKTILVASVVVPATFGAVGAFIAAVLSVLMAYLLVAVYKVTGFHMSTWIPFLWVVMQVLFVVLGSYSWVIDLI